MTTRCRRRGHYTFLQLPPDAENTTFFSQYILTTDTYIPLNITSVCYTIFTSEVVFNYALHTRLPRHRGHYVQVDIFIKSLLRQPPDAEDEHTTPVYYSRTIQNLSLIHI